MTSRDRKRSPAAGRRGAVAALVVGGLGDLEQATGVLHAVACDIGNETECRHFIESTIETFGGIDILINNAGISMRALFADCDTKVTRKIMEINFLGAVYCTKYALPYMIQQKSGRIIDMSSIHGLVGAKYKSAYVSAKHGIIGFTKVTALEMLEHGITANAICPTFVRTPLVEKQIDDQAKAHGIPREEVLEKVILAEAPMKRMLEPEEVAELVVYLASDLARNITGTAIPIDEGWTAQ